MNHLTPRQIVSELDKYIVGQADAKRAVAVAIRNRWRRQQLAEDMRADVWPKNIIMIGPTGVGKTEIARRLASLTGAPFIKVEATKYTEVGYHGRDVESMIRDLVEAAINLVRGTKRAQVVSSANQQVEDRLLELLLPAAPDLDAMEEAEIEKAADRHERTRSKLREMLRNAELEDRKVQLSVEQRNLPVQVFSNMGMEQMDIDFQSMF